jgi:hypothetical protein
VKQKWHTNTIFEENGSFFVLVDVPSDEPQDVERPSTFGHTEDAGPFDTFEAAQEFEGSNKGVKGSPIEKYKVLGPRNVREVGPELNDLARKGWKPILMSATQAHAESPVAVTVILESTTRTP